MSLTFISAGAGSGKTYTLTQTLGKLLNDGSVKPAGVIATTFTKKAATELRERVRQYLLEEGEFALANAMGQARIGTVNSVCGSLLERFAFEAGMATQQQVIEDNQAAILIREAIDAALSGKEVAELSSIANRLGIEDWTSELKELVNQARANDINPALLGGFARQNADDLLKFFPRADRRDLTKELQQAIDQVLPEITAAAATSTVKKTKDYLTRLEAFARKLRGGNVPWADWISLAKAEPEKGLKSQSEQVALIAQSCASHPELHADIRNYLIRMFDLCTTAIAHYRERKLVLGVVDFTDQEHLLLKLLDKPDVAAVLKDELDLLLVDEFQDTSPIQLALFLKLSRLAKQTYWVGDIKQAIYGFRGRDTELMQAILNTLPALGGNKQVLGSSWRSRPALVNLVNDIFTTAFADTLSPDEIKLKPERPEHLNEPAFANWLLDGKNVNDIAQSLAVGVRQLLAYGMKIPDKGNDQPRSLEARDIAILCSSHKNIAMLAAALRQAGIPVATSQPGLLATPEATLALACLRRLNDISDTVATAEIISLADSEQPEVWLADRLAHLQRGESRTLWREAGDNRHPLIALIAALRSELPLLAPREALQRVITAGQLPQRVLGWQQDPSIARSRLANLEALVNLAAQYEDNCRSTHQAATISGLLLWFAEQATAGQDAQAEPAVNAIRLLTHHAAKGLEWPVVILSDLDKSIRTRLWGISAVSTAAVDAVNPLQDRFIRYWPWPFGKQEAGIAVADQIDASPIAQGFKDTAIAEAKRLLYVSMTRPREMLILARKQKAKEEPWLETLAADWLDQEDTNSEALTLPSGAKIPAQTWALSAPESLEPIPAEAIPVRWFAKLPERDHLPLYSNPSAATGNEASIKEQAAIGQRIPVAAGADWRVLGIALHACLATSFTDPKTPLTEEDVIRILDNFQMRAHLEPAAVLTQIQAFHEWITTRWPGCRPLAEVPLKARLPNDQILNGRMDLLLETKEGFVLIDHKSSPQGSETWEKLAREYYGQLAAYAGTIGSVSEKEVIGQCLFLPVAGAAIHLQNK